jgi:hypothetical protein
MKKPEITKKENAGTNRQSIINNYLQSGPMLIANLLIIRSTLSLP